MICIFKSASKQIPPILQCYALLHMLNAAKINDLIFLSFFRSLEDLIIPLVKKVGAMASKNDSSTATSAGNSPFDLLSTSGGRNQHVMLYGNHVPKGPRKNRDPSPDLIEIQAQIESIR